LVAELDGGPLCDLLDLNDLYSCRVESTVTSRFEASADLSAPDIIVRNENAMLRIRNRLHALLTTAGRGLCHHRHPTKRPPEVLARHEFKGKPGSFSVRTCLGKRVD